MKHILEAQQWSRADLENIFSAADGMRWRLETRVSRIKLLESLQGYNAFVWFYEASTRTRASFELGAKQLGMITVCTDNAGKFSSAVKGETLEDAMKVLCCLGANVIVLRHSETGSAKKAAAVCENYGVSLINAGDGTGQHPTQALLDVYTIQKEMGYIDGLTVVMGGDLLRGRTVRSLSYLLTKFKDVRMIFVSPPELAMGKDILEHLDEHHVRYEQVHSLDGVLEQADVVYWTRAQKERPVEVSGGVPDMDMFRIGLPEMARLKSTARVMHPLPRVGEISPEIDGDPRAIYFGQVTNGLLVRMVLLEDILLGG